jgi:hypothetical protein
MRLTFFILTALLFCAPAAFAAGPYYARGDYYSGSGGLWQYDAGNELFDDGEHGDGAAGDGVYGVYVISDQPAGVYGFKIANSDWTEAYPSHPINVLANGVVWTNGSGDVVHFTLDTNTLGDGWLPPANAAATDQYGPPVPLVFELMGSAPELGEWNTPVEATETDGVWSAVVTIATPATYEFKFRVAGTWDICNFGIHYNMFYGDNFVFETTEPNQEILFEMNPLTGRGRAIPTSLTPTRPITWGALKTRYR